MIIVRNLSKVWKDGTAVLKNISFEVEKGEFVALLGASGSGKTTLLRCISMREPWTSGELVVDGIPMSPSRLQNQLKLRKEWAFLEEKPALTLHKSALKNVFSGRFFQQSLWRKLTGKVSTSEHVIAMEFLEKVGLMERAKLPAEKLSGGEKQRVAIARALAQGSKVIVADDPTKGLDPESANKILQDFRSLCDEKELTVICALQNPDWAAKHATRIWGLAGGTIVLDIPARRLTQSERDKIL